MDSRQPNADAGDTGEFVEEEIEVTRDELVEALREVVTNLSDGLKGPDAEAYRTADDLAQNDWFFAGVSDRPGQYAVTMWPAEGDEDMLRIDIGSEEDVQNLAADSEQIAALTDDFIEGMSEDYDDEDYDEEEDEDLEEGEDEEFEEEDLDEEDLEEDEAAGNDGVSPSR